MIYKLFIFTLLLNCFRTTDINAFQIKTKKIDSRKYIFPQRINCNDKNFVECDDFMLRHLINLTKKYSTASNITKMQSSKSSRYFFNGMPDFNEGEMKLSEEELQNSVFQLTSSILANFSSTDMNSEDGLYLGTAGVAYMFYHLSKLPAFRKNQQNYISSALEYLRPALQLATR